MNRMGSALAILSLTAGVAYAHDWYPIECCHSMNCAPVDSAAIANPIDVGSLPQMVVTSKHGTAIVPTGFPFRQSKDNRMHVCMRKTETGMSIICVFAPPTI